MKRATRTLTVALLAFGLVLTTANSHANVIIGGTRVVFPAQDGEVTVRLTNESTTPALIEAWVDSGDEHSTPEKTNAPFLITPPLFRMEPHKDQSLRILATPAQLPSDRETLFWLNVLEIPPKPTGLQVAGKNILQFAIRSRLKLFYRPARLSGDPQMAPTELTWKAATNAKGVVLEAKNPTPYYITVAKLSLNVDGKAYTADVGMVAPFATLRMPLKGLTHAPAKGTPLSFETINDFGALAPYKGAVAP